MIEIRNLYVENRNFSLKNISLQIQRGTFHFLIGPTGCGKTTLLEAVLGLRPVKKGQILLNGKDITYLPVHKRAFSYVPQDLAIFPHLTVEENIFYGIKYGNVTNKKERYREALKIAEALGITHLLKRKAINLSSGERQRIALVRALAPGYEYLLLDEPFSSLHEGLKRELWFLLKELQRKYGFTILMVSHDLEETFFLADHITVMIEGKIHQSDTKERVYQYPANFEVARFLGIKNIFQGRLMKRAKNYAKVFCEVLNTEISIPLQDRENLILKNMVTFGIRSEDIVALKPDSPLRGENLIKGIIREVLFVGGKRILLFQPENAQILLEISIPDDTLSKLPLKASMRVTIFLRTEKIFLLE